MPFRPLSSTHCWHSLLHSSLLGSCSPRTLQPQHRHCKYQCWRLGVSYKSNRCRAEVTTAVSVLVYSQYFQQRSYSLLEIMSLQLRVVIKVTSKYFSVTNISSVVQFLNSSLWHIFFSLEALNLAFKYEN